MYIKGANMSEINDAILHALVVRVTYKDNTTQEFRPQLIQNQYEIDIPQSRLDDLTSIQVGPKIQQFIDWLTGFKIDQQSEKVIITSDDYQVTDNLITVICKDQLNITLPLLDIGSRCTIKNATNDKNVVITATIDQTLNPIVYPREAYSMICDGNEWHIV